MQGDSGLFPVRCVRLYDAPRAVIRRVPIVYNAPVFSPAWINYMYSCIESASNRHVEGRPALGLGRICMLIALLIAGPAFAEGDAASGQGKVAICSACHGADGNSILGMYPSLAGQNERYLVKQMRELKSGIRPAPMMTGVMNTLGDQDIEDVAAFYASQASKVGGAKADLVPLAGQWPEYTAVQLKAFRTGERSNDGDARMMRDVAMDLSDPEIEALASYIHGLH
jgi:cytochrome c553